MDLNAETMEKDVIEELVGHIVVIAMHDAIQENLIIQTIYLVQVEGILTAVAHITTPIHIIAKADAQRYDSDQH